MKKALGREHAPNVVGTLDDAELVQRALARDGNAFRTIMQKYNQRLYRIARGILRNDAEAEDVVQEAYVSAFAHLDSFRGDSSLPTWLARITMNEALGRLRARRQSAALNSPKAVTVRARCPTAEPPQSIKVEGGRWSMQRNKGGGRRPGDIRGMDHLPPSARHRG